MPLIMTKMAKKLNKMTSIFICMWNIKYLIGLKVYFAYKLVGMTVNKLTIPASKRITNYKWHWCLRKCNIFKDLLNMW